jgi:hypothetical protein
VTAVSKLPLESFSANSPTCIETTPPKDRSSFQFRVSDVVFHPESSPIINAVVETTVTPTETLHTPKAAEVENQSVQTKERPKSVKRTPGSGKSKRSPQLNRNSPLRSPTRIWVPKNQTSSSPISKITEEAQPNSPFATPKRAARKSFSLAPTPNSALKSKPLRITMDEAIRQYEEEGINYNEVEISHVADKLESLQIDQFIEEEVDSIVTNIVTTQSPAHEVPK